MKKVCAPLAGMCSRRHFSKVLAAGLPAAALLLPRRVVSEPIGKPNSKVNGVQIGLNVPYSFGAARMSGEEILQNCVRLGLSAVELRAQPVETFLGVPSDLVHSSREGTEARKKLAEARNGSRLERAKAFRTLYEDAGVLIEILKVDGVFQMSDAELDYAFGLASLLGARAISTEISSKSEELKRVGSFADKHKLMVGYHGHATTTPEHWKEAFALAKFNGANVDLGHFVAGNNVSPAAFIEENHERITHVHVKDRKRNNGPNTLFGQGDTPLADILRLIRDRHWNIQATIEFEYAVPPDSTRMKEIEKTIRFCREALA